MRVRSKSFYGWLIITILSLIPLFLFLLENASRIDITNMIQVSSYAGRITALTGLVTFSITIFMSGRHRQLERFFGGMNRVYIAHHLLGLATVVLLLVHPGLLALSYGLISWNFAKDFLFDLSPNILIGKTALGLLTVLIAITLWGKLPYQIWRATHKFMGVAFLLGGLHALLMESDLASNPVLGVFTYSVFGIAALSYLYRTVFGRYLVSRYKYVVTRLEQVSESTYEVFLKPVNKKMSYKAGQFIFISFPDSSLGSEVHPFSIASKETANELSITIKGSGDYTNKIAQLQAGNIAQIEGPFGIFTNYKYPEQTQIWIAGGIGITPFMSMLRSMSERTEKPVVHFYASNSVSEDQPYLKEVQALTSQMENVTFTPIVSKRDGRLTAQRIAEDFVVDENTDVFICGPLPMMLDLKKQFKALGVKGYNIHTEEFALN